MSISDLHITDHARERFRKRFKKLSHSADGLEQQVERARFLGRSGDREYYTSPCGAVIVIARGVLKTVLKRSQISDELKTALRGRRQRCQS